ncbi:N-acetylneuraminate lyase [Procambarus clarkii]|uniref:N-acetylneuraminate lyase n=1 Tax=Procambarus clarkii TaxID=6728 RepID=UPI003742487F
MSRFTFRGMMAPAPTPFNKDGSLNLEMIPAYAKHLHSCGVKGVWVNGTIGEGMSMTVVERKAVAEAWARCRAEVSTMIVQCGAGCLKDTQDLARHAEDLGAEGVAVFPCLFDKPATTDELVEYMVEVAKACPNTPLFYYHFPTKTGVNLSMSEFLAKGVERVPTLAGIKFTDLDVSGEGRKCLEVAGSALTIFSGFDQTLQEALSVGFTSAVNGGFNFIPHLSSQVFAFMEAGNITEARKIQELISSYFDTMLGKLRPAYLVACLKTATTLLTGLDMGPVRLPARPFTDGMTLTLRSDLENLGLKVY